MARQRDLQHLASDLRRLEALLRRTAPSKAADSIGADGIRILNLACGECHESGVLTRVFAGGPRAGTAKPDPPTVELVGIDVRAPELARARQRDLSSHRRTFCYIDADAARLNRHSEAAGEFDLVFMRHQNFWNGPETWKSIFSKGLDQLSPGGRLIITSYFLHEHRLAVEAVRNLGATLLKSEDHREARILDPKLGKRVDGHVAVFERPE
ncbi:MAG TPA: class I SAM-dependent methyltransferase [Verrucomicrobiales bacterium]|nr:class I SAM-dependent methyltransferase [Verrucomicrobiales bacterium]